MKTKLFLVVMSISLFANESTVDCNQLFDLRKAEILKELQFLEEKEQSLKALKEANEELLVKKELNLEKQQKNIDADLLKAKEAKEKALEIYEKNKKILEDIKLSKNDKLSSAYLKMKDSKAAAILDRMKQEKAAIILSHLSAKKISKIMAKMDPQNASVVTKLLASDMECDLNNTK